MPRLSHGRPADADTAGPQRLQAAGVAYGRWSANKCYSGRIKVFGHSAIYRIPKNLISETNLIYVGDQIFGRDGSIFHSFFDFFCKPD
jgi:putative transposon-encoded protein